MADTIFDISSEYQNLRRRNPIACGEWLRKLLEEQGLSQSEIASRLGANRQIVGRYIRMAQWNKELKDAISKSREMISNTDLLKAASSPKNESALFIKAVRQMPSLFEISFPQSKALKELIPDACSDAAEISTNNLIHRESAELHEEKIVQEPLVPAAPPPTESGGSPERVPPQEPLKEKNVSTELTWRKLFRYIAQPTTVFLFASIAALSIFLIHQGIIFFTAVDTDDTSAISSSIISELVPLLSAACFALSMSKLRQLLAGLLLVGSIVSLAFFMHASLAQRHVDTSKQISALEKERASILLEIDTLNESAASLPSNYISRKQDIIHRAEQKRVSLEGINTSINDISMQLSSSNNIALSYGVWLRIAAMILSAILAHTLFARLRRMSI